MHILTIHRPENHDVPVIFDSPHSGRFYPADFEYACPRDALIRAEDNMVDQLFAPAPRHGIALLCAQFPRTYIDVNRAENDVDPFLLEGPPPAHFDPSARSHAGIGLIRRIVRPGMAVYDRKLSVGEVEARITRYYRPYHAALDELIDQIHYRFGQVWHVNCHSMPSSVTTGGADGSWTPDFVLGDRDGTSCAPDFIKAVSEYLKGAGYRVAINRPYKGVEIVRRHGQPHKGRHSLQLEVNKALYWNEALGIPTVNFNRLRHDLEGLSAYIAHFARARLSAMAAD